MIASRNVLKSHAAQFHTNDVEEREQDNKE